MGVMGHISGEARSKQAADFYRGWDRDLASAIPPGWTVEPTNCTQAQAEAGFSLDQGALVYDSDAVVSAGGAADCEVDLVLDGGLYLPASWALEAENLSAANDNSLRTKLEARLKDADGNNTATPEGLSGHSRSLLRTDDGGAIEVFGNSSFLSPGTCGPRCRALAFFHPAGWKDDAMHFDTGLSTDYSSRSSQVSMNDPRSTFADPVPADHYLGIRIKFYRTSTNTGRIHTKIPRLELWGQAVE